MRFAMIAFLMVGVGLVGCSKSGDGGEKAAMAGSSSSGAAMVKHELPKAVVDLPAGKAGELRTLVLAGGCFWCVEAVFEKLEGVSDVTSGYAGGTKETATYEQVSSGATDHAESVRITYDPAKISHGTLLRVFFTIFDPTTLNRQGPDSGRQYRTAIFYANDEERRVAETYIKQITDAKVFEQPIVTVVERLKEFYPAEGYHQDYVRHHPENPYVMRWAVPKMHKVDEMFGELVKK